MVRARPTLPAGHGELLLIPPFAEWAELARENHRRAAEWGFQVGETSAAEVRMLARAEARAVGADFSNRLGLEPRRQVASDLVIVSGHQPEFYHSGIWAKVFLLQRIADELDAHALDLVVDTDGFDRLGIVAPCFADEATRCRAELALGEPSGCYASTPVPPLAQIERFCAEGDTILSTLPTRSIARHFAGFCEALRETAGFAANVGELVVGARRRYERSAGTDYDDVPVSGLARTEAFARFAAAIALDAPRFAVDYNAELAGYRESAGLRNPAQPVPDLEIADGSVELPFWALTAHGREPVRAEARGSGVVLFAGDAELVMLPKDPAAAASVLRDAGVSLAPKALALTLFTRLFIADLFIHGVGGGRYDRVTDGIIRRYFGVEPPPFSVASLTMYLPLGAHVVSEAEVAEAAERLNRFEHNPDVLLPSAEFETEVERAVALDLARRKAQLVTQMGEPAADKKALGAQIREVNAELRTLLAPLGACLASEKTALDAQRKAADILTDRTYPFCFWAPDDIADKVW